jgi:UDP-N-acetyl-D-mannosaminuronic acid dehydrogenase
VHDGLDAAGVSPAEADVLVLGATYRPGVDEIRKTPALPIVDRLATDARSVTVADPVLGEPAPFRETGATVEAMADPDAETYDAVVMVTPHSAFDDLDVGAFAPDDHDLVVVDGRQALTSLRDDAATVYRGIGFDD